MSIAIPSFAKVNLGLKIGAARPDGFHELRTIYQTLALHDVVRVEVQPGSGIEIHCNDPRVPLDETNTCYIAAAKVLRAIEARVQARTGESEIPQGLKPGSNHALNGTAEAVPFQNQATSRDEAEAANVNGPVERRFSGASASAKISHPERGQPVEGSAFFGGKIIIDIDKRLPVQGGMGAASSNAVATMLGLERALGITLSAENKLRIAAEVGSDVPLFLIGGTVLGVGRGEEVYPLPDLPTRHLVVVIPPIGVSTPKAFAQWDELAARESALTAAEATGTISKFSHSVFAGLSQSFDQQAGPASGVPAGGGDRAETPLLDLVRAGIENDFERVVFPEYPDLREVKRVLLREGARYASLSGSGSTLYGLFASADEAQAAAKRMSAAGHVAMATTTLTRAEYWKAVTRKQLATSD